VTAADYVDEIPGSGRNRYFYKVRAVYPGEVRSLWSPTSVAFHQIDLSAAESPEILRIGRRDGALRLLLRRPDGPGVQGIRLLRRIDEGFQTLDDWLLDPPDGSKQLLPAAVRTMGRLLDLRPFLGTDPVSLTSDPRIVAVHPVSASDGSIDESIDLLADAELGRTALLLSAEPQGPVAVRVRYSATDLRTHTELPDLAEIEVDTDAAGAGGLWLQTLRSVALGSDSTRRDSAPVEVR
jgi:hypothetical protein